MWDSTSWLTKLWCRGWGSKLRKSIGKERGGGHFVILQFYVAVIQSLPLLPSFAMFVHGQKQP